MQKNRHRISHGPGRTAIVIMAAGKGTRLKSKLPKVLHEVGGKPLLAHVIAAATHIVPAKDIFAIIGHESFLVRKALDHTGVNFVQQQPQNGTGHALMVARNALQPYDTVIVLSGDAPMIQPSTIRRLLDFHLAHAPAMTILSARLHDPTGYGRVVRKGKTAQVQAIVEEKSASPAQKKLHEINSGFYAFSVPELYQHIDKLHTNNPHGEFYLTDMAGIFQKAKRPVIAVEAESPHEILGGNTRAELVQIDHQMRLAKCIALMSEGVTIFNPQSCVIDSEVTVSADTVIEPFVQLLGTTKVGAHCRIRSFCVIENSQIADGVTIRPGCIIEDSVVRAGAVLGPYSHLRPGSDIGEDAHLGNFVEVKKTRLGRGSKANHLTYLGDAEIGEGVNIGAGTITCNYDGTAKHETIIEDGVFIGSDSTLVAPVRIAKDAYVAAASCITDDVPQSALAIGRARQIVKDGWVSARKTARNSKTGSGNS
jgi:bifunctional UDP-N-acetylglucosamine pyrophosphorylase / glucosamine-1-phosphate N-acetyltransferase